MTQPKIFKVKKPWGFFTQYTANQKVTVKIIQVNKKQTLSLQMHFKRSELWIPLDNGLIAEINGKKTKTAIDKPLFIPKKTKHRLYANKKARILEISFGQFDEKDIIRFEDKYGRKTTKQTR